MLPIKLAGVVLIWAGRPVRPTQAKVWGSAPMRRKAEKAGVCQDRTAISLEPKLANVLNYGPEISARSEEQGSILPYEGEPTFRDREVRLSTPTIPSQFPELFEIERTFRAPASPDFPVQCRQT